MDHQTNQSVCVSIRYEWRGKFESAELEALHCEGFDHEAVPGFDWEARLGAHSLGWVCARTGPDLVGFVNVAWDGSSHAFILDTVVFRSHQRQGIGTELVAMAAREANAAGCEWLHVDFEDDMREFYFDSCGFKPTSAGLISLMDR
jgi:GNAT superfamily N-acetyltransferase